ncbi:MAG: hypothetical protein ACI3VB_07285 [Oscillospiraceae bacterium]
MIKRLEKYYKGYKKVPLSSQGDKEQKYGYIYVGNHYKLTLTDKQLKTTKLLYSLLFAVLAICHVVSMLISAPSNISGVSSLYALLCCIALLYFAFPLFSTLFAPRLMKEYEFQASYSRLRTACTILLCSIGLLLIVHVATVLLGDKTDMTNEYIVLLLHVVEVGCASAIFFINRPIGVKVLPFSDINKIKDNA